MVTWRCFCLRCLRARAVAPCVALSGIGRLLQLLWRCRYRAVNLSCAQLQPSNCLLLQPSVQLPHFSDDYDAFRFSVTFNGSKQRLFAPTLRRYS